MKQFEIWSEGYAATGEAGPATFHGIYGGLDFKDACTNYAKLDKAFARYFNPDRMTYWGCSLFDNEVDARKSFG